MSPAPTPRERRQVGGRWRTEYRIALTEEQQRRAREQFDMAVRSYDLDRSSRLTGARMARQVWKEIAAEHGFDPEKVVGWRWAEEWAPYAIAEVEE